MLCLLLWGGHSLAAPAKEDASAWIYRPTLSRALITQAWQGHTPPSPQPRWSPGHPSHVTRHVPPSVWRATNSLSPRYWTATITPGNVETFGWAASPRSYQLTPQHMVMKAFRFKVPKSRGSQVPKHRPRRVGLQPYQPDYSSSLSVFNRHFNQNSRLYRSETPPLASPERRFLTPMFFRNKGGARHWEKPAVIRRDASVRELSYNTYYYSIRPVLVILKNSLVNRYTILAILLLFLALCVGKIIRIITSQTSSSRMETS